MLRFIAVVRRAATAFFRHDLALKRERGNLCVVLQERSAEPPAASPAPAAPAKPRRVSKRNETEAQRQRRKQEVALAREQLRGLLDQLSGSRQALRHLAAVEQAVERKGFDALDRLPEPLLRKALEQLEGMVTNWSPVGLATLRSKMAVALLQREKAAPDAAASTAAEDDLDPSVLPEVEEGSPEGEDDAAALAAAYAALGSATPAGPIEFQGELGSASARALAPPPPRATATAGEIQLRTLQS